MKKSRLQKVSMPDDITMHALYSSESIIRQAWALNTCELLDFEMLQNNFTLNLKAQNATSLHSIYVSKIAEHFDAWLLENRGSKALISSKAPSPASFLIIKGDIDDSEMSHILEFIKQNTLFQHLVKIEDAVVNKSSWLAYIELCQPYVENPKQLIQNII